MVRVLGVPLLAHSPFLAFLLNHSREYALALSFSVVEAWLTAKFAFSWRIGRALRSLVGVSLIVSGLIIRTTAMLTAGHSFDHHVVSDFSQHQHHKLVTSGIYRRLRHPSYLGFFLFSIGCPLLLGSHLSALLYTVILHKFFRERIWQEEAALMRQYPQAYAQYKKAAYSGLPFVK